MFGAKVAFDLKHEEKNHKKLDLKTKTIARYMDSAVVQSSCSCGLYRTQRNWSLIYF